MTWLPEAAAGATPFARTLGLCPALHADLAAFVDQVWVAPAVDGVALELCRRRIAQLLGCEATPAPAGAPPLADAAGARKIAALEQWRASAVFSPTERACLRLAEQFVLAPRSIEAEDVAAVSVGLSPAGTVALVEALALFDGLARFRVILGIDGWG